MEQGQVLPTGPAGGPILTPDDVRRRLARSVSGYRSSDPATLAAVRGDHSLMPGGTPPAVPLTPAAVLVPLVTRPDGLSVLLTQRTQHLAAHAGQIAFPGGKQETSDADAVDAALRETEEEVGLPRDHVEVVGRLDTYVTSTGFEVTPVVGLVRAPYPVKLDPFEVAELFEVPLDFILDPANRRRGQRERNGAIRHYFIYDYRGHEVWGATAAMLVNLAEILVR